MNLTLLCPKGQYVPISINSGHVYDLYDSGSNVTIILHGLAKTWGLQDYYLTEYSGRRLAIWGILWKTRTNPSLLVLSAST